MKLKQIPEDFRVDEIYDLENFKDKDEGRNKPYYYFKLIKNNYAQMRALEIVAKTLNTSKKLVHFSGTKDKAGITSQLISVYGINEDVLDENLKFLEENFEGLKLEFIGKFKSRINLGDNFGNSFKIVVRDLTLDEIESGKNKVNILNEKGVLNYFDEQRFGYANNSHIVGKYLMLNLVEKAVFEIMTSLPNKTTLDDLNVYVDFIKKNWEEIKNQNIEIIDEAINLAPRYLRNDVLMLEHLKVHKNDFPGAFRKIHKKLRMLYINAYQSYIFNECVKKLNEIGKLNQYSELALVSFDTEFDSLVEGIVSDLLVEDELVKENFKLKHMPELRIFSVVRETRIFPSNIQISEVSQDDLNDGKMKCLVTFELGSGQYATNVIKQLFE